MSKRKMKNECERCGTCCLKGGPTLHIEDQELLQQNSIDRESLITIRKGEPVYFFEQNRPEWIKAELIKLKGLHGEWSCIFYGKNSSSCSIYQHRPLECIVLKCWDTAELEAIAGKNLLNRFDIIPEHEPVIEYIHRHEKECSLEFIEQLLIKQNGTINKNSLAQLSDLVNKDLLLRSEALANLNFTLNLELFYFGRPLFKILSQFALIPREVNGRIELIQD